MPNTNKPFSDQNLFVQSEIFTQTTSDGDAFLHSHPFYEFFYIISGEIIHLYKGSIREKHSARSFPLALRLVNSYFSFVLKTL